MALEGRARWTEILALARSARSRLAEIPGVRILSVDPNAAPGSAFAALDETKIVFGAPDLGIAGPAWQRALNREYGVEPELAGPNHLLLILTIGSVAADVDHLVDAVARTVEAHRTRAVSPDSIDLRAEVAGFVARAAALCARSPEAVLAPREAFFAPHRAVPLDDAEGRVAAEVVTPYPPGIPVLMPGERIGAEVVAFLRDIRAARLPVSAADPTLERLLAI
jgi:arginine/lysine/ornithine decarboxylase